MVRPSVKHQRRLGCMDTGLWRHASFLDHHQSMAHARVLRGDRRINDHARPVRDDRLTWPPNQQRDRDHRGFGASVIARPPVFLLHGTARQYLPSIRTLGIHSTHRHYVFCTVHWRVAWRIGSWHGQSIVLRVAAEQMYKDGWVWRYNRASEWGVQTIPPRYITTIDSTRFNLLI